MKAKLGVSEFRDDSAWEALCRVNQWWIDEHLDSDGVLYCLPLGSHPQVLSLFKLTQDEVRAEQSFHQLCEEHHAIGWSGGRPLKYSLLESPLPLPPISEPERLLEFGWTKSQVDWLLKGGVPGSDVFHRRRAAVGRLLTRPDYAAERDQLRDIWLELQEVDRPILPLHASIELLQKPGESWREATLGSSGFLTAFDAFCTRWQLLGMTTWELPEPDGPKWDSMFTPAHLAEQGILQVHTPWHFPLKLADGIGELAVNDHLERSSANGVDDHGSWEAYAHFLPLLHWKRVIDGRYPREKKVASFQTELDFLLASILHLSVDRVQRLKKWSKALRTGRFATLRGRR